MSLDIMGLHQSNHCLVCGPSLISSPQILDVVNSIAGYRFIFHAWGQIYLSHLWGG
ncbi:MAG: hypothetical protein ACFE9C_15520 [Candidatus Hodarchaeota archaeon]